MKRGGSGCGEDEGESCIAGMAAADPPPPGFGVNNSPSSSWILRKHKKHKKKKKNCVGGKDEEDDTTIRVCVLGATIDDYMYWFLFDFSHLHSCITSSQRQQPKRRRPEVGLAFHHHQSLHKDQEEGLVISPVLSGYRKPLTRCLPVPFWGNSFASLGSIVFSIGGSSHYQKKHGSNLVHFFDTRTPHHGWIQAPSMLNIRFKPQVVALRGKLYVFGCSGIYRCRHPKRKPCGEVWAEVFDPYFSDYDNTGGSSMALGGRWTPLPKPPSQLLEAHDFVVITPPNHNHNKGTKDQDMILLNSSSYNPGCAYQFHIATNRWTVINCNFQWTNDLGSIVDPPILVDNVLYWVDDNINAYDIGTGDTYVGPVQDLLFHRSMSRVFGKDWDEDYTTPPPRPSFIHLGGRHFCLMCFVDHPQSFHCLIIKVSRTRKLYCTEDLDAFFLNASVLSCQSYPVDRDCFLRDGRMLL